MEMNDKHMSRLEFLERIGASATLLPLCLGMLTGCSSQSDPAPTPSSVDFTLDVSTGALSQNGGYLVKNGVLIARTTSGNFLAVSAACTHEGTTITYQAAQNDFYCPNHGAMFSSTGVVTRGPAARSLTRYTAMLTGTSLHVTL